MWYTSPRAGPPGGWKEEIQRSKDGKIVAAVWTGDAGSRGMMGYFRGLIRTRGCPPRKRRYSCLKEQSSSVLSISAPLWTFCFESIVQTVFTLLS
ncbi:hypothetical protein ACN47E_005823 [Coniothyrium glycines]